jgi:hypothetical protein
MKKNIKVEEEEKINNIIEIKYKEKIKKIDKKYFIEGSFLETSLEFLKENEILNLTNIIDNSITIEEFLDYLNFIQFKDFELTEGVLLLLDFDRGKKKLF